MWGMDLKLDAYYHSEKLLGLVQSDVSGQASFKGQHLIKP